MSSGASPLVRKLEATIPAAIAAVEQDQVVGEAPMAGSVTSVTFTPEANITGQATDFRTFSLLNKGADGNGTTVVASLAFSTAPVAATDFNEHAITLSATPADRVVAAGDILAWAETVTGDGLASPGGKVQVEITRS